MYICIYINMCVCIYIYIYIHSRFCARDGSCAAGGVQRIYHMNNEYYSMFILHNTIVYHIVSKCISVMHLYRVKSLTSYHVSIMLYHVCIS